MTWRSITDDEMKICQQMRLWIAIARKWAYGKEWLPADADLIKSALFERLRSGREPLEFPPPLGYACPWYALVEERGPNFVASESDPVRIEGDKAWLMQQCFGIIAKFSAADDDYIVKDLAHDTPYRFRLWHDRDLDLVAHRYITTYVPNYRPKGGWVMQNLVFASNATKG